MSLADLKALLAPRVHRFRPRLFDAVAGYDRRHFLADLGAGLTVGVVALPLAMAFGIASGVKPEEGLITAVVAGVLISALGGSNVQIGGPAGAFIVIVYGIIERYGLPNLLIATMLAGIVMLAMGLFKLGALVRYVPVSIVIGFTNGIAVLIGLSQLRDLLGRPLGPAERDKALAIVRSSDGIDQALQVGADYVRRARTAIEILPDNAVTAALAAAPQALLDTARR